MWKLLPWSGRGASGYPQRECFFCCITSTILPPYKPDGGMGEPRDGHVPQPKVATSSRTSTVSTGTSTNWFCSNCLCQNVANEDGTPAEQYSRPMWDEAWNRDRSQLVKHTRPQASKPVDTSLCGSSKAAILPSTVMGKESVFAFCHTCQTNQILTLNMLADYLPSEDDPDYQQKLGQLPEYEASIASRYPPVCPDCAPKVQERIAARDQFARSWSLGKWLDLRGGVDKPPPVPKPDSTLPDLDTDSQTHSQLSAWLKKRVHFDKGSPFAIALFVVVNLTIWATYLATALERLDVVHLTLKTAVQGRMGPTWLLTLVLGVTLLPRLLIEASHMDPLKGSIEQARARQLRVEAKGLGTWRATQRVILLLRLSMLLSLALATMMQDQRAALLDYIEIRTGSSRGELVRLAALTLLIGESGITALAATQLHVQEPRPLRLISQPIVGDGGQTKLSRLDDDALLNSLSLDDRVTFSSSRWPLHGQGTITDVSRSDDVDNAIPRPQRDADGDAIMEDAATYSARRASTSSECDSEQGSPPIAAPSVATSGSRWPPIASWQPHAREPSSFVPRSKTATDSRPRVASTYNDFQLGPQRFWATQKPTGLEDVFGRAVSLDDEPEVDQSKGDASAKWSKWLGFS